MHVQLHLTHRQMEKVDIQRCLEPRFETHDPATIRRSPIFEEEDYAVWDGISVLACDMGTYRLFCFSQGRADLDVFVDAPKGDLRDNCQSALDGLRGALKKEKKKPKLQSAKIIDLQSSQKEFEASSSLIRQLRRRDLLNLMLFAAATGVYVWIGINSFASSSAGSFVGGAISGLVGGLVALVLAGSAALKGTLIWR